MSEPASITREEWERLLERVSALEKAEKQLEVIRTKPPARTRGGRLPEGWVPETGTVEKMMAELNVSKGALVREHRKFCDYFLSAPGQKGVKLDWDRAWCNWMRSAAERGQLRGTTQLSPPRRTNDDKIRELMEMDVAEG